MFVDVYLFLDERPGGGGGGGGVNQSGPEMQ